MSRGEIIRELLKDDLCRLRDLYEYLDSLEPPQDVSNSNTEIVNFLVVSIAVALILILALATSMVDNRRMLKNRQMQLVDHKSYNRPKYAIQKIPDEAFHCSDLEADHCVTKRARRLGLRRE